MKPGLFLMAAVAAFLMVGCGSGASDDTEAAKVTPAPKSEATMEALNNQAVPNAASDQ